MYDVWCDVAMSSKRDAGARLPVTCISTSPPANREGTLHPRTTQAILEPFLLLQHLMYAQSPAFAACTRRVRWSLFVARGGHAPSHKLALAFCCALTLEM
jgi:hypothetical protein